MVTYLLVAGAGRFASSRLRSTSSPKFGCSIGLGVNLRCTHENTVLVVHTKNVKNQPNSNPSYLSNRCCNPPSNTMIQCSTRPNTCTNRVAIRSMRVNVALRQAKAEIAMSMQIAQARSSDSVEAHTERSTLAGSHSRDRTRTCHRHKTVADTNRAGL
jgi:hypothetical protein